MSIAGLGIIMTAKNTLNNIQHNIQSNIQSDRRPEFSLGIARTKVTTLPITPISNSAISKWLVSVQKLSIAFTALSFLSVSAVYGWNVHVQKKFDQQFRKLETLKQSERQLIVANESLDHDLITNIDRLPVKLVREKPQQSIFIISAPTIPVKEVSKVTSAKLFDPLGY